MFFNTTGDSNTGIGWQALPNNTTGYQNTATGRNSLFNNRTGVWNTAMGDGALYLSTLGNFNTAVGLDAAGQGSTTGVSVLGTFSSGNGYTPGTYPGVLLNLSSGSPVLGVLTEYYPIATIVVGTGGTISSVTLETSGKTFGTSSTTIMGATIYPLSIVDSGPGYTASSTFSNVQLSYISGGTATTYPVVNVFTGSGGTVSSVTIVSNGSGFQDNTTIMGANLGTGTFSVKAAPNSIGPGTGFTVRVASLQTAESNTVVGFKSLYYNTIGSNNVSFGHEAGNYTNTAPYFNYISNNSIFIGYFTRAKNSNETNQIVIGHEAIGNGSNTVTLGNDSIIKTYLKGNVGIGTDPSTKLHIYSTQSGAFRLEDGTQNYSGYVLTSDANGVGTWQGNTQVTITTATATALPSWNNTTIMCNRSGQSIITIPDTGLPPNFSFRFIVISSNTSATIAFTYSSPAVSILPNTLLTFAQYESGVIDRLGTSSNYYITF